ncbi:hypothetical protein I7I50_02659 [Histoplasma capsulatum G186AR]|uniref:Uncharacterized protein n=1 Tax=Ajellomyces capsulatus TaxID=5037 RepID=A0A8H7Z6V7_AJECA|nr:hypothetical protein I7I52_00675 [Histoplasma capsulatum]QSS71708.1 hypothetical protein I7I50_02659 [Histoplasma capsulatum G186AR]
MCSIGEESMAMDRITIDWRAVSANVIGSWFSMTETAYLKWVPDRSLVVLANSPSRNNGYWTRSVLRRVSVIPMHLFANQRVDVNSSVSIRLT